MADSIRSRRSAKERKAISKLVCFLTEYAESEEVSAPERKQLEGVLDQIGFPIDQGLIHEACWIFTRKVGAGQIVLRGKNIAEAVWEQVRLLTVKQREQLIKMMQNAGWVETDGDI